ncbi:hypothetical protein ACFLWU_00645 [Chloroflexota bacterium]
MNKVLWVDDDIQKLGPLVRLLSKDFNISIATDVRSACQALNNKETFDLYIVDIIVPDAKAPLSNDHTFGGQNLIKLIREYYHQWVPIIIYTIVRENEIKEFALNHRVYRIAAKGTFSPSQFKKLIYEALEFGKAISIDEAIKNDDPTPIANVTIDAILANLHSPNEEIRNFGLESAKMVGGPELTDEIIRLISAQSNNKNEFIKSAQEVLSYLFSKGMNNTSHYKIDNMSIQIINNPGSNNMFVIGHLDFKGAMRMIRETVNENTTVNDETRASLKADLDLFEKDVQDKHLDNKERISLLERIKSRAPWLRELFIGLTAGACANVLGFEIVTLIKLVFGGG